MWGGSSRPARGCGIVLLTGAHVVSWLVPLMRYLTLFAVVSLIAAVAWTNLQPSVPLPEHVPDAAPVEPDAELVEPDPAPEVDPGPPVVIAVTDGNEMIGVDPGAGVVEPATEEDVAVAEPDTTIPAVIDVVPVVPVVSVEPDVPVVTDVTDAPDTPDMPDVAAVPPVIETTDEPEIPPVQRGRQLVGQIMDTAGGPLPHVQIRLTDRDGSLPVRLITADANGIFLAAGLLPGQYALAIVQRSVPGHIARPVALGRCRVGDEPPGFGSVCVDMLDTTRVTTVDVVLPFASIVQGRVLGVDGEPAEGALVRAVSRVPRFERVNELVRTDARGQYTLRLVAGPYELQVVARGGDHDGPLACALRTDVEEGALQLLEVIDFSSPDSLPSIAAVPPAPVVADSADELRLWPVTASAPAPGREYAISAGLVSVTLEGRVMTRWGESVESVIVACFNAAGDEVARAASDATGTYTLIDVPVGRATIRIGMIDVPDALATPLLHRPDPLIVDIPAASPRAVIEDVIVDVDRVFRVAGRVEIDASALAVFQMQLIERDEVLATLTESRVRRTFLSGLQLTVGRMGERRSDRRPVFVEDDGSFRWSTLLPSGDVAFRLEARSDRLGGIYAGRVIRPVTPAGVTTTEIVIEYPVEDR